MTPPIVIDARSELLFFRTADAAQSYVEEIDIENGEYGDCWDSEGRLLRLEIEVGEERILGVFRMKFQHPILRELESEPTHGDQLRATLIAFLERLGAHAGDLSSETLSGVLGKAVARCGWT
jgi:hypothetical protein